VFGFWNAKMLYSAFAALDPAGGALVLLQITIITIPFCCNNL